MSDPPSDHPPSADPSPLGTPEQLFAWADELSRALSWPFEWDPRARCLWFWPRPGEGAAADRAELELHVHVPWDAPSLTAALRLPAAQQGLDYRNARQRLQDPAAALEVVALLEGLSPGFALDGVPSLEGSHSLAPAQLRDGLQHAYEQGVAWTLWWGGAVPSGALGFAREHLGDAITALCTVGELLAWSPANAYVPADAAAAVLDDSARRPSERKSARELRERPSQRQLQEEGRGDREQELAPPSSAGAPPSVSAAPSVTTPSFFPRPTLRISSRAPGGASGRVEVASLDPKRELAAGVRVQVVAGPFAGRSGTVQQFEGGKEPVRVLVGQLVVNVAPGDLVPLRAPGRRPMLSSSHRRNSGKE